MQLRVLGLSFLQAEKGESYFRSARCLESDCSSQGSGRAVCWDFPGI